MQWLTRCDALEARAHAHAEDDRVELGLAGRDAVDLNINPTWFARADVRYLQGDSDVKLYGVKAGEAELDPVILGVGVGARF